MTVHAFSSYSPKAGSTRVRLYDWFRHLEADVESHTYLGTANAQGSTLVRNMRGCVAAEIALRRLDVTAATVIVSREVSPISSGSLEQSLLRTAQHSVFDFDDALFANESRTRRLLGQSDKCRRAVSAADVVIAGNDHLADWAAQHSASVVMIPSCVEPLDYQRKRSWELGDPPAIVWLGSPSTEAFLLDVAEPLRRLHTQTGARLRVISGPVGNPALAPMADMLDRVPWSLLSFADALSTADVAIAPLPDTPYARGKCAYKLLQYAATGLPMVGSPVGANRLALSRFNGIAASTEGEWFEALATLVNENATGRRSRGEAALTAVSRHYAFAAWAHAWRCATGIS